MHRGPGAFRGPRAIQGLLDMGEVVVWSVILGTLTLVTAVGLFGFLFSRRTGWFVLVSATATMCIFVYCAVQLVHLLG